MSLCNSYKTMFHKDLDRSHSVQSVIFNNILNYSLWKNQIKMGDAHMHRGKRHDKDTHTYISPWHKAGNTVAKVRWSSVTWQLPGSPLIIIICRVKPKTCREILLTGCSWGFLEQLFPEETVDSVVPYPHEGSKEITKILAVNRTFHSGVNFIDVRDIMPPTDIVVNQHYNVLHCQIKK